MCTGGYVPHGKELYKTLRYKVIAISKTVFKYEVKNSVNEARES